MIDHVYLAGDRHGKTETQECRPMVYEIFWLQLDGCHSFKNRL